MKRIRVCFVGVLLVLIIALSGCSKEASVISTGSAPGAIGPYSQAIAYGDMIYTSGQIGLDPTAGTLVEGGIEAQTKQALENVRSILTAHGSDMGKVVKVTIYMTDLTDFDTVNTIYAGYFTGNYPARSCVQVSALPKGALIEIEAVAAS